jgi:hypothetical protein
MKYDSNISVNKTETMAVKGMMNVRTKIARNNDLTSKQFNYLG